MQIGLPLHVLAVVALLAGAGDSPAAQKASAAGGQARAPAIRLRFAATAALPVGTAEKVRRRLEAWGAPAATAAVDGSGLVVTLPAMTAEQVDEVRELLLRPSELSLTIVENDSRFMKALAAHATADAKVHGFGVEAVPDRWVASLDKADWRHDVILRGPEAGLRRYLADLPAQLRPDQHHALVMLPRGTKDEPWATAYLDLRRRVVLRAAAQASYLTGESGPEVTLVPTPDAGAQMERLTRKNLGSKMVLAIDGEPVWEPVIWTPLGSGRRWTIYVRNAAEGKRLAASLLGGPLPTSLRFLGQESVP